MPHESAINESAIRSKAGGQALTTIYDLVETKDVEKVLLLDLDDPMLKRRKPLPKSSKPQCALVGDVRSKEPMIGVELVADANKTAKADKARDGS